MLLRDRTPSYENAAVSTVRAGTLECVTEQLSNETTPRVAIRDSAVKGFSWWQAGVIYQIYTAAACSSRSTSPTSHALSPFPEAVGGRILLSTDPHRAAGVLENTLTLAADEGILIDAAPSS